MLPTPFLHQSHQHPEALALAEGEREIRYGELLAQSQSIAAALRGLGIGPGRRVALHIDRGIDAVAAVFGVLLTGAAYLPLDLKNPPARREFILRDADAAATLGTGAPPPGWHGPTWLDVTAAPPAPFIPAEIQADDLAAILYTSGSTGQPKGVALSHGAVAAFSEWAAELMALGPKDRIASSAPLFFDLSTFDLYAALGRGASLHFVPTPLFMAPARLAAWLGERTITGWYTVPSLLAFLAYKGNLAESRPPLRFLIFAGEVFPTPDLRRLADLLPDTRLYNFYGPTETNVCCYWPVDRNRLQLDGSAASLAANGRDARSPIPIGVPACDDDLRIDPDSGELWVRGPTLLSGYWSGGRLHNALIGNGWYATGDRVSLNERGEHLFHGRLGRMLKCAGHRVEPAEIEAALNALPGVRASAVVGLADPAAGQRPAALLALDPPLTLGDVQKALKSRLPAYMQPCRFRLVDDLPRLANGKLDYPRIQALMEE
ncbi:amino acid adenylation domain-containing protein [Methylomagnum sp.]